MQVLEILKQAIQMDASDIFIMSDLPITYKCNGVLTPIEDESLDNEKVEEILNSIYETSKREKKKLDLRMDDDFSFSIPEYGRFRVNVYRQRGSYAAVIRVIQYGVPDAQEIGIPEGIMSLTDYRSGLIIIAGSAGAGKSTTLACMIDRINHTRACHIITMEDPIEYIHRHDQSIISQRELYVDTPGYLESLRSALRESPDVILLGEMRDYDTMSSAITAAETGTLLLSTLHTNSAANTINRILDVFPATQQSQVRIQLSQLLRGVVCQQLLPGANGNLIPAFELLKINTAVQTMIRDGKLYQLESVMQTSSGEGMFTMDNYIANLYHSGMITKDTALSYCFHPEQMKKRLK